MVQRIPTMHVPPATLQIEVRANCDYSDLPKINRFKSRMSIANGLSAPKIVTAIGTDGKPYKQLVRFLSCLSTYDSVLILEQFKSGNDDLRQDAIMEQVFDQVSRLLKNHTATRLRNLGIRTYKVLPLSTRSGLMEFVQDTIPLHQWVMPAHEKYYPSDWKNERCRKEIGNVQQDSLTTRVKVWHKTADNFHPVLRYFLLERFQDPDEWFERRTAYTRSTAAISILGHVLGLGDRHCHNILLDEKSGEVVHIDLGVSFEAGRVLPVPEVVPFRLTRDIVDAMGYTKTEGVFQRCCEFMLDTLREEKEAIMTLLNVLRYDPLVNWSVTPTKAKRMQENQDTNAANGHGTRGPPGTPAPTPGPPGSAMGGIQVGVSGVLDADQESHKKREEQAGEAGRALSVVEKKLSKTLSTKATVNELIQQATDERNLAVLYCGWSSYA
jgi:ataxia telangiectasia mutated family protein